jgi:hypothetical protein
MGGNALSSEDRAPGGNGETDRSNEVRGLAEFVEEASGGLISNGLGLIADRLAYLRLRQALSLRDKIIDELKRRGVRQPKQVAPKFLIPLLEAATLEEDEDLHTRYATLLANARDPNYLGAIKQKVREHIGELGAY